MSLRPRFRVDDSHYAVVVRRPVAILMVTIAVAVFGAVSYQRLALTLMPDMSYPSLTVRTTYPGTAPEEMENVISRPLEQQLGIIPKLVSISSISKAGQSDVMLEFQWKTDMDVVAQEVREKIDRIRLPDGAQRPLLLHYDPSLDPILRVGLAGPASLYELRHLAEHEVKRRLEALPGVAAIQVRGGLEEQFLVALDEAKLSTLKLDITQIGQRLQAGNVNMPGGNLREGQTEYVIRTLNEFRSIEEIGALIVSRSNNSVDIRLRDIATVTRFHKDREIITRVNGQESVELDIFKEGDANVLSVAAAVKDAIFGTTEQQAYVAKLNAKPAAAPPVADKKAAPAPDKSKPPPSPADARKAAMAEMERARATAQELITRRTMTNYIGFQLPPGTTMQLLSDQSIFIRNSINEVRENAIFGGLIAIAVLYLFLRNVVQTLIVSLCIPISILATFAPMHMAGVSLNIISLGGLALGVGNLVDNAIVVLESVFRCREEGDDPVTSVVRGTSEVAMPVVASTLTTVAVFFPIVFVEGVAGQLFGDMALAVVFSQIASLIAALYLIPMLASKAAGMSGSVDAVPGGPGLSAQLRRHGYLQFPANAGASRLVQAGHTLSLVVVRLFLGAAVIIAAVVKGLLAVAVVVAWPVLAAIPRARGVTSRVTAWLAQDRAGRLASERLWPGMLAFSFSDRFAPGLARVARWIVARHWRWIVLLVIPGLLVGLYVLARARGWIVAPPPAAPPLVPGMPVSSAPAQPAAWYVPISRWAHPKEWWRLTVLCVPGVLPFLFVFACAATEIVLRISGTVLQTLALMIAQLCIGGLRACMLGLAPLAGSGLGWFERGTIWMQDNYPRLLRVTLQHRLAVLGSAFAALVVSTGLIVPRLGSDLIPQVHQGEFNLDVTLPIGTPLERTGEIAEQIDQVVRAQPDVERTAVTVGAEESASTSIEAGEHSARLTVRMKTGLPVTAESALIDRIRGRFRDLPEVKLEVSYPALFSFKNPIEVEIRGHDLTQLKRFSREAESLLAERVPGLVDVRSTLQTGHPEIQVVYHRDRLAEFGLNLRSVADLVRNKVQGRTATEFRKEDQMIDIVVRLREEDRFGVAELRRLVVNPGGAVPIALSAVAELTINEGPSEIRRVDQQRTALITANIRGADLATVTRDIMTVMNSIDFPAGFSFDVAGQNKEMQTSLNSLLLAFALAVFLVYIVMASQFESLVQPLLIMMTVPLAMIGVVWVLWLANIPVTIMVFLGLIILVGIVVNNAIVLIDYINTLRGRGVEKTEAIIEAGRARLRPIIMTALTTVVGLVPMALGIGEGAEIRTPMAITVIVGLSAATVLTLVVVPTLYYQFTSSRALTTPGAEEPQPQAEPQALGQ